MFINKVKQLNYALKKKEAPSGTILQYLTKSMLNVVIARTKLVMVVVQVAIY